jgi:type II secretory ATPase GspE/PulE/Tfp pilus assembly ATPase PilB-like protein
MENRIRRHYNSQVPGESAQSAPDARVVVDAILADALRRRTSDIHIEPTADGCEIRFRIDGQLQTISKYDTATGRSLVLRLMVMAQLLTYRLDIPQEGRLRTGDTSSVECRVAIMPTIHGLRAAVRMPADGLAARDIDGLSLPPAVLSGLKSFAATDSGMLIVTGPAGSGKTTTNYALLSYIAQRSAGLSIVALEDPVERNISGVTQIEVSTFGQLTYERALRSMVRQDPQVLMLGEIRDGATASLAIQAALSGHRLICTLHAGHPGGAIARLLEMGLEPYQLTSAIYGIVAQRLLRRLDASKKDYSGRIPAAELAMMTPELRAAVLRRDDAQMLQKIIETQSGYVTMRTAAADLARSGMTDDSEIVRVFGA